MASSAIRTTTGDAFSKRKYDYIIIGGGTAGLVVASRLTDNSDISVGVIEAGHVTAANEALLRVPGHGGRAAGSECDWKFETVPQVGLAGRKLQWPRGKILGGTSAMNLLVWNWAAREDYDTWEELGNAGWNHQSLRSYFEKSHSVETDNQHHQKARAESKVASDSSANSGGERHITVSYPREYAATHQFWHETLANLGIPTNPSHMNGCNIGAWTNLATIEPETQERSYSTNAYLAPVTTRANLHVLTGAEVSEIIFERHSTTVSEDSPLVATGVRYRAEGEVYEATVSREIILCAGSIGSPQVLELSGIGNQQLLERAGVKAKFHNPNVGENLQDHIMTISVYELKDDTSAPAEQDLEKASIFLQEAEREYNESKTGYLTTTPSSMAYLPGSSFIPESKRARLAEVSQQTAEEITISTKAPKLNPRTGHHPAVAKILQRQFSLESRLGQLEYVLHYTNSSPFFKGQQERKYACLHQILQYPYSVGSIHVSATTNLTRNPVIDPKYYQDKGGAVDAEVMALGQEFGDKIMKTTPLSSIIKRRVWPPEDDQGGNKVDWSSWIRDNTVTDWHPIGTCALLPLTNGGVVNDQLRVYGTNNVRVVDASIIPLHISAHIQATVYAIAEKAADIILNGRRSI